MIVVISDLHLGEGGPLEDFAFWERRIPAEKTPAIVRGAAALMHAQFERFSAALISAREAHAPGDPRRPTALVLLGDILDLLQTEGALCDPGKIRRIAAAHAPFFAALGRVAAAGIAIHWLRGNHDQELADPLVAAALRTVAPFLDLVPGAGVPDRLALPLDGVRVLFEHGSQFDPFNALRQPDDPRELAPGARIVLHLVNPLEPRAPALDLLPDAASVLWYALRHTPNVLTDTLRDFFFSAAAAPQGNEPFRNADFFPHLIEFLRRTWIPGLEPGELPRWRQLLQMLARAATRGSLAGDSLASVGAAWARAWTRAAARRLLEPERQSPTPEPAPVSPVRVLVTGHTHSPGITWSRDGLALRANCGSWKARVRPSAPGRLALEQPLDVLLLRRADTARARRPLAVALRSACEGATLFPMPAGAKSSRRARTPTAKS